MFFSATDVVASLKSRLAKAQADGVDADKTPSDQLLAMINQDLPLKEHTDLFKYALFEKGLGTQIEFLAADLLADGRASVTSWFLMHDSAQPDATFIKMVTRTAPSGELVARWFCAPPSIQLLSVTYSID